MISLLVGSALQGGKYGIERVLGQGAFGITYLGIQTGLNRKVAIKEFFMKLVLYAFEKGNIHINESLPET